MAKLSIGRTSSGGDAEESGHHELLKSGKGGEGGRVAEPPAF